MIYPMYSIYDKVTHNFSEPFLAINEDTAVRRFNYVMSNSKMVATDCQLFKVGEFDSENGAINPKVEFVCNYEVKE